MFQPATEMRSTFGGCAAFIILSVPALLFQLIATASAQSAPAWILFDPTSDAVAGLRSYKIDEITSGVPMNFDLSGIIVSKIGNGAPEVLNSTGGPDRKGGGHR